ncbi:unnamed protein product [Sphagnum jensenii]|uniref:Phospholipid scramblase n=1 Tax=Sphagnum jensenii TaxID=128206 RepID=A0ABP0W6S5_9BRYO
MSYPPNNNQGMQANYTGMQQGPGQGYVQSPNDIRAQNQGSYPSGMQGTGSYGPAVAGPQYCLPQVSAYAVSKKVVSMSGGDWKITDATGRIVFKVSGRVASVRDKRFLRDPSNKTVLRMQKKIVTMHDTWQIYSAADTLLATVKKSSLVQFKTAMDVFLGSSSSSKNADYVMQGDFLDRNLTIFQGAQQAALVTRQITFASVVVDKDNFGVTIFPGVDIALIFALIVIMDEVYVHHDSD